MGTQQVTPGQQFRPGEQITIYVNSRAIQLPAKDVLTFDEVVALAFPNPDKGPNIVYTVTFRRGQGDKPQGTLVEGESVKVKDGMIFDVTATDKS